MSESSLARLPVAERIALLRAAMLRNGFAALIVPSADPHLSEYLPERWQTRQFFSGFTGSMGTLVLTGSEAGVWADSRYWVQAERELAGSGVSLHRQGDSGVLPHVEWLAQSLEKGAVVGVDGACLALSQGQTLRARLVEAGITLCTDVDVPGEVWQGRPGLPQAPVRGFEAPHAVPGRAAKLDQLRAAMAAKGADWHWISTLDDIAWLSNLRGADVDYNPVFLAHALIGPDKATLFIGQGKIDSVLAQTLAGQGWSVAPYEHASAALAALPAGASLLVDPARVTLALRETVPGAVRVVESINPSTLAKSRKLPAEAAFVREAMEYDGAAMCAFYAWFEQAIGRERITELTVDERLSAERAKQPGFVSLSFPVIAGFNANGAMPHYRATEAAHAEICGNGLLLIDSGGQYLGGTTDITRVWAIGSVSPEQQRDFTLVLKGMIALSRARFPRGTLSPMLDTLARAPIWAECLEYGHGTGHGVGYYLNVHEGPQSISKAIPNANMAMEPGMITSNEPGLYRDGKWGVRIENLLLNVAAGEAGFGEFLEFETLTLCPIDRRCILSGLLRDDEVAWLDAYHAEVRRRIEPLVSGDARAWLIANTAPLMVS